MSIKNVKMLELIDVFVCLICNLIRLRIQAEAQAQAHRKEQVQLHTKMVSVTQKHVLSLAVLPTYVLAPYSLSLSNFPNTVVRKFGGYEQTCTET